MWHSNYFSSSFNNTSCKIEIRFFLVLNLELRPPLSLPDMLYSVLSLA